MPILSSDITNGAETGVFDVLMSSVNDHLNTQFEANRITGSDYATVYLGSIQVAMQQAITFLQVQAQDDLNEEQSAMDLAIKQAEQALKEQEALRMQAEVTLMTEKAVNAEIEGRLLEQQILKVTEETELLEQKGVSEYAQTLQATKGGSVDTQDPGGILGAQTELYTFQTNGFKHKAAHDAVSAIVNIWSVATVQSDEGPQSDDIGFIKGMANMLEELYNESDSSAPTFNQNLFPT